MQQDIVAPQFGGVQNCLLRFEAHNAVMEAGTAHIDEMRARWSAMNNGKPCTIFAGYDTFETYIIRTTKTETGKRVAAQSSGLPENGKVMTLSPPCFATIFRLINEGVYTTLTQNVNNGTSMAAIVKFVEERKETTYLSFVWQTVTKYNGCVPKSGPFAEAFNKICTRYQPAIAEDLAIPDYRVITSNQQLCKDIYSVLLHFYMIIGIKLADMCWMSEQTKVEPHHVLGVMNLMDSGFEMWMGERCRERARVLEQMKEHVNALAGNAPRRGTGASKGGRSKKATGTGAAAAAANTIPFVAPQVLINQSMLDQFGPPPTGATPPSSIQSMSPSFGLPPMPQLTQPATAQPVPPLIVPTIASAVVAPIMPAIGH